MLISVIPTPTSVLEINFSIVSLVILFLTSSTITDPIVSLSAKEVVGSGSESGVSLSLCGKRFITGCAKFLLVNGAVAGLLEPLIRVK